MANPNKAIEIQGINEMGKPPIEPIGLLNFLREKVDVDMLLSSRRTQAALAKFLNYYFSREDKAKLPNSYPVLKLISQDKATSYVPDAFMLRDKQYYYYIPNWGPGDGIPPFLRPEDVVQSKMHGVSYSPKLITQIMKDLGIDSLEKFWQLEFKGDSRILSRAEEDIPFNKPFCRVAIKGGEAERYNYNTQEWEPNGDGKYKPILFEKLKNFF